MISQSRILLALALANSVSAFLLPANPGRVGVQSARLGWVAKVRMAATDPATVPPAAPPAGPTPDPFPKEAYPGLVLPYGTGAKKENILNVVDQVMVREFFIRSQSVYDNLKGKPKSDLSSMDELQMLLKEIVPGLNNVSDTYKTFGGDDYATQLCVILESNPFYAAALTPRAGGGFELINYDPVRKDAPYSTRVMRTIGRNGPQVNVKFSVKPEGGLAIDGFDIFEKGVKVEQASQDDKYWASVVLYDLFFVAQTLHATIHIFHYVLTNALTYASEDYRRLHNWANEYNENINMKYDQVSNLLVNIESGVGVLTSPNGLGGSAQTRELMVDNIAVWGKCSTGTEFLDHLFQSPRKDLEAAGLLTEYFKHTDLGAGCAVSATAALEKKSDKLDSTNAKIQDYIEQSGAWPAEKNGIKTVRSLLDVMLITGVIHGGTLSMTRLSCKPEILRWRNIAEPKWTAVDAAVSRAACGTIIGAQKNKHVCGSKKIPTDKGTAEDITKGSLEKVLASYDRQADRLKEVYQKKIVERPDFNDVGFILTDYCTDFYDGKQVG